MKRQTVGRDNNVPTAEFGNKLAIVQYIHCKLCFDQLPRGKSMEEYARLSVGMTRQGLQVWCARHDCNVMHVDYQGHKFPADMTRHLDA